MTASNDTFITIRGVSKAYAGVQALRNVSFSIAAGEVHALCGENGAGKSTLIKIITGSVVPDSGAIEISGTALALGDVHRSEAAGIAVIHQESTAFLHLNSEDNLFAGREPARLAGILLDRKVMHEKTRALIDRLGETFDLKAPLSELSVAQRQMVAIARTLSRECRLLIMDEPTASLSNRETEVLFRIIRQLKAAGVSILYVSHRLEEVFSLSDRVTVFRDGQFVATTPIAGLTREGLIKLMVGREIAEQAAGEATPAAGTPLLEIRRLSRAGAFRDISLSVAAGEVVGLSGLVGAGRTEVAQTVFGIDSPDSGEILIEGRPFEAGSVRAAMEAGIALVPEDRQHSGLVLPMSVAHNLSLPLMKKLTQWGLFSKPLEKTLSERLIRELTIKTASDALPVASLSGGNQQKVVLGKWLGTSSKVLILDEPTRGVDVGAKAEIYKLIRALAEKGMAILVISSDLPELLLLSDKIHVMRSGTLSGTLSRSEASQEEILHLALPDASEATQTLPEKSEPSRSRLTSLAQTREFGVFALLLLTVAAVSLINPAFLALNNIRDMLVNCAPAAIAACGVTLVVVTSEIDISIGSLMGLLAAGMGLLVSPTHMGLPVAASVMLTLLAGAGMGLLTGVLVVFGRVPSIIVTLGMLTALRGITELLMNGEWIIDLPAGLRFLGTGYWLGIPLCLWAVAAVILVTLLLVYWTPLGRRIYAVGSNPSAARLSGISEKKVKLFVFAFTGLLVAVATVFSVPRVSVIDAGIGIGFELLVVTCVVVGGTAISGGRGTILGVLLGVLLIGIVRTVLIYLKLGEMSTYWERAIQGAFILMAVLADHFTRRRKAGAGT